MPTPREVLQEIKANVREAHSELRLAINSTTSDTYLMFFEKEHAEKIDEFLDAFLYE